MSFPFELDVVGQLELRNRMGYFVTMTFLLLGMLALVWSF